ncbi:uncharacterized protein LOC141598686 [Silene latifolia]|uniref:uncharacterized protein LOC141598686 n=1 Tax=Silene latifolia TaxID=37657 RepID=UPI003D7742B2
MASTEPTTTETTTVTTTATSTTSEGPVLTVLTKRIRALRKKLNRILQMEQSVSQGKPLNPEQLDVLRSKPALLTLLDELEKLRAPISAALDEEISLATTVSHENTNNSDNAAEDLVKLMYFGSLFDVKQQSEFTSLMLTKTHERACCLTYDCVTDDAVDLLGEKDFDLISELLGLMIAKPVDSTLTHRDAVDRCLEHAKLWIQKSDQPVHPQSDVTYAMLREKLNKIMSSGYYTATPEMKGPVEVAAAAAVANFGSFQVPIHESMVNAQVPIQVEGSHEQYQVEVEGTTEQYQETENTASYEVPSHQENAATYEEPEIAERHQSVNSEEFHKDEKEAENPPPEVVSVQTDQEQYQNDDGEHGFQNVNYKDQQYAPRGGRRGGSRGGGGGRRGGYFNGRGGRGTGRGNGPYQNGRSQYNDNSYPRNYYNRRGRGGAAGGGGNGNGNGGYFNNSSGAEGNHPRGDIGVAS